MGLVDSSDRKGWSKRQEQFAAFRAWEEARPLSDDERARAFQFALDAARLWHRLHGERVAAPRFDDPKIEGIARMHAALRVLGSAS